MCRTCRSEESEPRTERSAVSGVQPLTALRSVRGSAASCGLVRRGEGGRGHFHLRVCNDRGRAGMLLGMLQIAAPGAKGAFADIAKDGVVQFPSALQTSNRA